MLAAGDPPSLYRYISFTHVCSQLKIPEYYDTDSAVCQQIQIFIFRGTGICFSYRSIPFLTLSSASRLKYGTS